MPTFSTAARLYFRHADTSLLTPLDEVEGVDRVLRLRRGQQAGDRVLLGAVALLERPLRRALDQVECDPRRVRRPEQLAACAPDHLGRARKVGLLARRGCAPQVGDRLVEEPGVVEDRVHQTELERLLGVEHAVLAQRVGHDHLHRCSGADEPRQQLRATPGREETEEDLRRADVTHRARDRAVVAVKRDLEPTAERGAVDRGERRERKVP